MDNELKAITEDYYKLLVQTQAEIQLKEHYMSKLASMNGLYQLQREKIERLEMVLRESTREL
jgi:hypothetical protein